MSETFTLRRQVEFNHCDPAGIVFYPRYFEMISAVTERFFADAIGYSWAQMGRSGGAGTPMGEINVRFHAPSRLEDLLAFSLTVERIGASSARIQILCHCGDQHRFTCKATLVYARLETGGSAPWPDTARAAMARYLSPSED